jgi:hypothetical protein
MEKADSKPTGYAIECKVKPPLWSKREDRDLPLKVKGIRFSADGQIIKTDGESSSFSLEEFQEIALDTINRLIQCHNLSKGKPHKLVECKIKVKKGDRVTHIYNITGGVNLSCSFSYISVAPGGNVIDSEQEDFKQSLTVLECYNDPTLRGALNYYSLALKGADPLVTAGNLYMAMEELWNNPEFGNLKGLAGKLGLSHSKLKQVKRITNEGRHAFIAGRQTKPLTSGQIKECKQGVRELILAYVEWLRDPKV